MATSWLFEGIVDGNNVDLPEVSKTISYNITWCPKIGYSRNYTHPLEKTSIFLVTKIENSQAQI